MDNVLNKAGRVALFSYAALGLTSIVVSFYIGFKKGWEADETQ